MANIEVAVAAPALLGECPLWAPAEQLLYWIDIDGRAVHRYDPATGADEARSVPGRPGSLALTTNAGTLLMAIEYEVVWLDWPSGTITPWLEVEDAGVGIRLNDGRTDPAGRFIVGSMFDDTSARRRVGSLHQIDADGTVALLRSEVGVANGLGFDAKRDRMYFADTPTEQVIAWDYDADTGARSGERVFFDYGAVEGKPDGACVDADGCYWSASVYGWAVTRVTPDGRVDSRIEVPVEKPTMPAFGGSGLDTLFLTSIAGGGPTPSQGRRNGVEPGALLAIDLSAEGIVGRTDAPFAGRPPG